jgi:hypothetical protein
VAIRIAALIHAQWSRMSSTSERFSVSFSIRFSLIFSRQLYFVCPCVNRSMSLADFPLLHSRQLVMRFSKASVPPRATGIT